MNKMVEELYKKWREQLMNAWRNNDHALMAALLESGPGYKATAPPEEERQEFEDKFPRPLNDDRSQIFLRRDDGDYLYRNVQEAWEMFNVGRAKRAQ